MWEVDSVSPAGGEEDRGESVLCSGTPTTCVISSLSEA